MLLEIYIENIALISKLRLELGSGFNVLTGETGAGKSILLDAMALILGAKADTALIRHGFDKALVEGVFIKLPQQVVELKAQYDIAGDELILSREISQGRSACRINGRTFPLNILREFGEKLVNIYGQHDFQTLLKPENHWHMLDAISPEIMEIKAQLQTYSATITKLSKELLQLETNAQQAAQELDFLTFQAKEIDEASLTQEEEDTLINRQKLLANAEKISNSLRMSYQMLYSGQSESVSDKLAVALKELSAVSECSTELLDFYNRLFELSVQNDDLSLELKAYLDTLEYDPHELEDIDERLYHIKTLKRKYGTSIEEILEYRAAIEEKLNLITYKADNEALLKEELQKNQKLYEEIAQRITYLRKEMALALQDKISKTLSDMNMNAQLRVDFTHIEGYTREGRERAEFYIKTNAGESFKPLVKIASGGELARIMLALRTVLNTADPVPTLVFDEVDAGMGGITLSKVAAKLDELSGTAQVLCVTHSAQLAAKAKKHFLVTKTESQSKTFTNVENLDKEARIKEIARMLDGHITDTGLKHAKELIKV